MLSIFKQNLIIFIRMFIASLYLIKKIRKGLIKLSFLTQTFHNISCFIKLTIIKKTLLMKILQLQLNTVLK
ncbi:hypothetical protein pb186bvf_016213 [Paramecium bursaria]